MIADQLTLTLDKPRYQVGDDGPIVEALEKKNGTCKTKVVEPGLYDRAMWGEGTVLYPWPYWKEMREA